MPLNKEIEKDGIRHQPKRDEDNSWNIISGNCITLHLGYLDK